MSALSAVEPITVRSPQSTRPWQHVLEPLGAICCWLERLAGDGAVNSYASAFNFGPSLEANRPVGACGACPAALARRLERFVRSVAPHEAGRLHLQIDKVHHQLSWRPCWNFATTVARTVAWYRANHEGASALDCCLADLEAYQEAIYAC